MRILLIEDDPIVGEAVLLALEGAAYGVDWAKDAASAAELIDTNQHQALLLDLGFDPGHVLNARMDPAEIGYDRAKTNEAPLDIAFIPLDDKPTYSLLQKAETTAVFQLESRGMKELIKKLKNDPQTRSTPVIFLAAMAQTAEKAADEGIERVKTIFTTFK